MNAPAKELLFCWVSQALQVLVPKKRGRGFLRVPYGHHYDRVLTKIANDAGVDVFGLDGALEFQCPGAIYHGEAAARKAFVEEVIPPLERYYGWPSREIKPAEFWAKHPLKHLLDIVCNTTEKDRYERQNRTR